MSALECDAQRFALEVAGPIRAEVAMSAESVRRRCGPHTQMSFQRADPTFNKTSCRIGLSPRRREGRASEFVPGIGTPRAT